MKEGGGEEGECERERAWGCDSATALNIEVVRNAAASAGANPTLLFELDIGPHGDNGTCPSCLFVAMAFQWQ